MFPMRGTIVGGSSELPVVDPGAALGVLKSFRDPEDVLGKLLPFFEPEELPVSPSVSPSHHQQQLILTI